MTDIRRGLYRHNRLWIFAGLASVVLVNVLFFFLLGAPTPVGQTRTDEIAGLRRYLLLSPKKIA